MPAKIARPRAISVSRMSINFAIGGGGKDVFVLGPDTEVDRISDYAKGEIVDVTQVLAVASGINLASDGYLRVTSSGLIQFDSDGGGDEWATLATINGSSSVTFQYLSGGAAASVTLSRTAVSLQSVSNAASPDRPDAYWQPGTSYSADGLQTLMAAQLSDANPVLFF